MHCENCGTEVTIRKSLRKDDTDDRECPDCGAAVEPDSTPSRLRK